MHIGTIFYHIRQGIKNIWTNKMFSLASIATMTACIFLLGVFYSIGVNFNQMVHEAEEGVAVTVFFNEDITTEQIEDLESKIRIRPEVAKYRYISAEEAWENYKKVYFEGKEELAEGFENDNPLSDSANFEIYLKDVSKQAALVKYLEKQAGVREVHQAETAAKTLTDFNSLIGYISAGVIIILLGVAVFLISNTVTVGIAVRKEEIAIMKYIGATDAFVRGPFVVEGILIGLLGSVIPLTLLFFLYRVILDYVAKRFAVLSGMVTFAPVGDIFRFLIPVSVLLGIGIGYLGSRVTLRRHLHV